MAIFSGKIIQTRFTSELNDTIEILFEYNGSTHPFYIAVDPTHPNFKALVAEGWDIDRVQKETVEFNRAQSRAYNQIIDYQVEEYKKDLRKEFQKKLNQSILDMKEPELSKSMIFKAIVDNNEDEETIFKMKLAIFERSEIKALKDRTAKLNIRKAKTILEVLSSYYSAIS